MDLAQAFFLLQSLKQNLPSSSNVNQKWVDDFHSILDNVEGVTNSNLSAFRVQPSELHHPITSVRRGSYRGGPGQVHYSKQVVVERARLLHKLDAVLGYFQYTQGPNDPPKQGIGFKLGG
jgi:hypothetical protein